MKKVNDRWIDDNNNSWSASLETKESATEKSEGAEMSEEVKAKRGRGRPKVEGLELKSRTVAFRCTEAELAAWNECSSQASKRLPE